MSTADAALDLLARAESDSRVSASAAANIRRWLTEPPFGRYRARLLQDIEAGNWKVLDDAFYAVLEFGTGGMNVSGVTKSGSSKFHGEGYDYLRDSRFAANDRSNTATLTPKPKSKYQYPGGNIGGPVVRDKVFFFAAFEGQRQQVDSGSRLSRTLSQAMRNGDFSELLTNRGSNLNSPAQLNIPQGFPNAGQPAPNNDMRPYMTATGKYLASLYPLPNYNDPKNLYNARPGGDM